MKNILILLTLLPLFANAQMTGFIFSGEGAMEEYVKYQAFSQYGEARRNGVQQAFDTFNEANLLFENENYRDALIYYMEGIEIHKHWNGGKKNRAVYYLYAAYCAAGLDDRETVYRLLRKKNISPLSKERDALHHAALIYEKIGNYQEAIKYLEKAISIDKFYKRGYCDIVRIYEEKMNTYRKAVKYRKDFKKYYPNQILCE